MDKGDTYFQQIIYLARSLAYLLGSGGLVPMGIELFVKDTNLIEEEESEDSEDKKDVLNVKNNALKF